MGSGFLADSLIKNIFPTEVDKASVPYTGRIATEHNMRGLQENIGVTGVLSNLDANFVPTGEGGFLVQGNGGLKFQFRRGRCVVAGYYIDLKDGANITQDKDSIDFTVDASARSLIFLSPQIDPTTNNVSAVDSVEINVVNIGLVGDTVNIPNKGLLLAMLVADGAGITSIHDLRQSPMHRVVNADNLFQSNTPPGIGGPYFFNFLSRGYFEMPIVNGKLSFNWRFRIKTGALVSGTKDITLNLSGILGDWTIPEQITLSASTIEEFSLRFIMPMGQGMRHEDVGCTSFDVSMEQIQVPAGSEVTYTNLGMSVNDWDWS